MGEAAGRARGGRAWGSVTLSAPLLLAALLAAPAVLADNFVRGGATATIPGPGSDYDQPADDNAADKFWRVLALDPDNERATSGLRRVAARYEALIQAAMDDGAATRATRLLRRLASVSPAHPRLSEFEGEISARKRATAVMEAE